MTLHPTTLDEIDFWDLDMFVSGDPHAAWRLLRRQAPVWWHDRPGGEPFWCVSRYADAHTVLAEPLLFSSADGIKVRSDAELAFAAYGSSAGPQPIIHTDPPRHQQVRKLVAGRFTPRSVGELEELVRDIAARCIDEALVKGDVDFVVDIAHRIPAAVTLCLLGIAEEHWDRMAELEHLMVTSEDPEFRHGGEEVDVRLAAGMEIRRFFAALVDDRLRRPGDDLISTFLAGRVDGEQLSADQVVAEAGLLLAGGLDTTRAAASAGALLPLLEHPDQMAELRADRSLLPSAVEEFVRWASPVGSETRTVTADTTLLGVAMRPRDRLVIWTASANRDESVFDRPDAFDIRRRPNRHLGFAYGEHFCLGAHLARLVLLVEFDELLTRVAHITPTGPAVRVRSNFVGGLKHLPVRLAAA